jgi:uncharacterized membrane protein
VALTKLGVVAADAVARFVGTWYFVLMYTFGMFGWIILHKLGILNIDSPDFIRWNLWLSYFAGIQASILLMAANRAAERDNRHQDAVHQKSLNMTEDSLKLLKDLEQDLDDLAGVVEDLVKDELVKHPNRKE